MSEIRNISDVAQSFFDEVDRVGWDAAAGLSPRYGAIIDPTRCKCGNGCESVLECQFWYWLRKTEPMELGAQRQVQIGRYRVDALVQCDDKRVVVELDGKEFHQDWKADKRRDEDLLESIDAVIRIPYSAMWWYPSATFSILARWYPRFTLRATDIFCCSTEEFIEEMRSAVNGDGDYQTEEAFLEWADPSYELWKDYDVLGWVGSPRAWIQQRKVDQIQRRRPRGTYP